MNRTNLKHFLLGFLIILSVILSLNLWFTDDRTEQEQSNTQSLPTVSQQERSFGEVYAPYQTVHHRESGTHMLRSDEVNELFADALDEISVESISPPSDLENSAYFQLMSYSVNDWLELVYNDRIPLEVLQETGNNNWGIDEINNPDEEPLDVFFDHLSINLEDPSQIILYDSLSEQIYTVDLDSINVDGLTEYLGDSENDSIEVDFTDLATGFSYLPTESFELDYYDYVVERLPNSMYVTEFFRDTSSVEVSQDDFRTHYFDFATEVLINERQHTLSYINQRDQGEELSHDERFNQAYNHVNRLENWPERTLFYDYNQESGQVSFQRYIGALPIFDSNDEESIIDVTVNSDGLSDLKLPLRVVQTPLQLTESTSKTLPSGDEVIAAINTIEGFNMEQVQEIRFGLSWEELEESEQIIHLEPNWFIRVDDNWHKAQNFVEERGGNADGL